MKRILLTGGGSGGHIYPLLAVAEKLKGEDLRYFGAKDVWSAYVVQAGIPVSGIAKAKLRRYFSLLNIIDGIKFTYSILQALVKVAVFRPHVAFSKGGPGALPVLLACYLYGVPIIIHESDSVAGLTSRVTGKWAKIVEVAWNEARVFFPNKEVHRVGIPMRSTLIENKESMHDAKTAMECEPGGLPVLLVIGGSQGSERINNFILENLVALLTKFQIIHQTGSVNYESHMRLYGTAKSALTMELRNRYHPYAYLENKMGTAYRAADCALSRSGSALFELAAFGIPGVLVPLPEAAHDHQRANAYAYAKTGAAVVIEEENFLGSIVLTELEKITIKETHAAMSAAARAFAPLDAAEKISIDILNV
ncbi:MAG: UDP-N-acetylglucosamine--N-acetylmuramyl-(pentapeptide) pyrophosphoryl-undecaprenol N-acetylglucosamine transferase [bacterium]|nr:UDP-N-acetylglucosamine--N-acetylmuramyl-(pentapeptide) pyrophosphoryl-undecaprenol N-acetylglucosamine transferase [bacterium]